MKVTKTKEIVTEEIEVNPGTYYFKCEDGDYYKFILEKTDGDGSTNYTYTSVTNFSDIFGIRVKEDYIIFNDNIPYTFSAFIREISGKKIEKEDFEQQKQEVIKRIADEK